jgi:hypothetical protein
MDKRLYVLGIFFDFAKAYNVINHQLLILTFIVPVGVYQLYVKQRYVVLLKNKSDWFRSFWTIFRLCSYPVVTETLHVLYKQKAFAFTRQIHTNCVL